MGPLVQIALLIGNTVCTFLTALLIARFYMQVCRAPFDNPLGHFVLQLTNWAVLPARRLIPPVRGFDTASLLLAYLLQVALLTLIVSLGPARVSVGFGGTLAPSIALGALSALTHIALNLLVVLLFAQAVLSWFAPHAPLYRVAGRLTDPVLRPLRSIIPPVGGIDLTPLVAILLAQVLMLLL